MTKGKKDAQFRTKRQRSPWSGCAGRCKPTSRDLSVGADSFSGEDYGVKQGLRALGVGYVLALGPSQSWWHP
jgi:hypothetical protein